MDLQGGLPMECYDTWNRHQSVTFSSAKGLQNAPGENNCFVNSAVQVFWHLDVFRRSYRRITGHTCMGNSCIFCSLKVMFTQFQYSDKTSLTPDHVRTALAETFADQQRFQLGHMDDVAECFENILRRIHYHLATNHNEDTCNAPHCIPHQKFAMTVFDQLVCPCGAKSEPLKFHELVHYISANSIVAQSQKMRDMGESLHGDHFGITLRNASVMGDFRPCPNACGAKLPIKRTLLNLPDVVSIGLIWHSDRPNWTMVNEVVNSIGDTILLQDVFHNVICDNVTSLPKLQLTAVVCYYGKHYSTFIYHSKLQYWIYFDDATVKQIGPDFQAVKDKCCKSRYQPLLLLYTNPNPTVITGETAMKKTVMAPDFSTTPCTPNQRRKSKKADPNTSFSSRSTVDSTSSNEKSSYPPSRRSVTPSPESHSAHVQNARRSLTPAPNQCHAITPERPVIDHNRQQSYINALSKTPKTKDTHLKYKHKTRTSGGGQPPNRQRSFESGIQDTYPNSSYSNYEDISKISRIPDVPDGYGNVNHLRHHSQSYHDDPSHGLTHTPSHAPSSHGRYIDDTKRSPIESGLATLPRKKDRLKTKSPIPEKPVDYTNHERQGSTSSTGSVVLNPAYKKISSEYVDQQCYLRKSESSNKTMSSSYDNSLFDNNHSRQTSSSSAASDATLTQSRQDLADFDQSDDGTNNVQSAPLTVTNKNYINRNMVANLLQRQQLKRQPSTASSASFQSTTSGSSLESDVFTTRNGNVRKSKALLTVDIPLDSISLESQKDSGYGSSDRNSSSSTGSTTLDPFSQYFISKGLIPPKNLDGRCLNRNFANMNINNVTNHRTDVSNRMQSPHHFLSNNSSPCKNQIPVKANIAPPYSYHSTSQQSQNHSNHPYTQQPRYRSESPSSKPSHFVHENHPPIEVTPMERENFDDIIEESEQYMDSCMLAETSEQYTQAIKDCQLAVDCLDRAMAIPDLSEKRFLFAQDQYDSCMKKSLSLSAALERQQNVRTPQQTHMYDDYRTKRPTSNQQSSQQYVDSNYESDSQIQQFYQPTTGMMKFVKPSKSRTESPQQTVKYDANVVPYNHPQSNNSHSQTKNRSYNYPEIPQKPPISFKPHHSGTNNTQKSLEISRKSMENTRKRTESPHRLKHNQYKRTQPSAVELSHSSMISSHAQVNTKNYINRRTNTLDNCSLANNSDTVSTNNSSGDSLLLNSFSTDNLDSRNQFTNPSDVKFARGRLTYKSSLSSSDRAKPALTPRTVSCLSRNGDVLMADKTMHAQIANRVWSLQKYASQPDCPSLFRPLTSTEISDISMPFLRDKRDHCTSRSQPDLSYVSDGECYLGSTRSNPSSPTEDDNRMTVRDLKSRFESVPTSGPAQKTISKRKKRTTPARKRSKSESNSEPKPALKSKSTSSSNLRAPRKSVTFCDNELPPGLPPPPYSVAVGVESNDRYHRDEINNHRYHVQHDDSDSDVMESKAKYFSQFSEDSASDSPYEVADDMCGLCNKRGSAPHSQYCTNCGFYMSQFQAVR